MLSKNLIRNAKYTAFLSGFLGIKLRNLLNCLEVINCTILCGKCLLEYIIKGTTVGKKRQGREDIRRYRMTLKKRVTEMEKSLWKWLSTFRKTDCTVRLQVSVSVI